MIKIIYKIQYLNYIYNLLYLFLWKITFIINKIEKIFKCIRSQKYIIYFIISFVSSVSYLFYGYKVNIILFTLQKY